MYRLLIIYFVLLATGTIINLPLFGKEVQLADVFFIFILASLIWNIKKGDKIDFFKLSPVIKYLPIVLLLLLLIACGFSTNITKSLVEFAAISYLVILYLWVGGIHIDQRNLKSVLHFWLYLSGGLCVLALGAFITSTISGNGNWFVQIYPSMKSLIPIARVKATFPTMNMFASFLHVGIVFLLALIAYENWRKHYIIFAFLLLTCIFLTASRNLLGIFITIFLAVLPIKGKLSVSVVKYISFSLSLLLLFFVLITTIWCVFPSQMNYNRDNHTLFLSINTSPSLYAILNKISIRFIKQKFLVGVGPGMFNQTMVEQLDWDEVKDTYNAKGITNRNVHIDPHNTYLGWAAEAGLPFAVIMVVLFYIITRFMWKGYKAGVNSFRGRLCYVCICGMVGFLVNGLYIDILTMRHLWLMMGLGTLGAASCLKNRILSTKEI